MTARMFAQLAYVFLAEADEVSHPTPDRYGRIDEPNVDESRRLRRIADALIEEAMALGFDGGADAAFG